VRAANRAKDEFLATLSHELRTPINAIMGWGQILQSGMADPARTAHAIDAIVRNAAAQARLIEDLLDLSRIISGKLRLDVELVDLGAVVGAAALTIEPAAQVKGLRLQSVIEEGARVYGDRQRLQQAVWNLLSNAVKFTPRGGSVQTHVRRVGSHVEISVSDTGDGIAADVLPFVFDRFRQADSSSTRQHAGLGLGLAIVRHIVELHGGTVHVASEGLTRGATFRLCLPISIAAADPPPAALAHPAVPTVTTGTLAVDALPDLAGTRILVVEDDADAREMVAYLLRQRHADVVTSASVAEALIAFDRQPPDVLLSDIEMPNRDGFAFIAAVRAKAPADGGDVPAAALTAYSRPEDRAASMLAGYDAHLSKPVDLHELIATVARLRARRRR
jgi:CheY-like chemotaxis protein